MKDSGNVAVNQPQTILAMRRMRLAGEAILVEGTIKPLSASVAGEHATGSVGPMSGGGQADHQQTCIRLPQTWNRLAPIVPMSEAGDLVSGCLLPPLVQTRAQPASGNLRLELSHISYTGKIQPQDGRLHKIKPRVCGRVGRSNRVR